MIKQRVRISDDFVQIKNISNPKETYRIQSERGKYKWFFPQDVQFMDNKVSNGAAQVRCYGRFLTEMIMDQIEAKLRTAFQAVKSIQQKVEDETHEIHQVDCHIVMSIAGGTGCGSFLNVAWALKNLFPKEVNIIGYGVLFSVFRTMDVNMNQTPRVVSNSYAAVLDLDYLMSATQVEPITVTMNGKDGVLDEPLYNQFYVIDNETENGKIINTCDALCDVISTCLFVSGGAVGDKLDSALSNVLWSKGHQYNVSPKNGWVQGLGACQIIYNGESLADIYADKAALEVIRQLKESDADVNQKAIVWTETEKIREDGSDYNYLTDSIYTPEKLNAIKMPNVDVEDSLTDLKNEIGKYLASHPEFPNKSDLEQRKDQLKQDLRKETTKIFKDKHGIGNAKDFLNALESLVNVYRGEMEQEAQEFKRANDTALQKLETEKL